MAIYAIFNVAIQNRKLADVRMRGFYVEKVYSFTCARNNCPMKMLVIVAIVMSIFIGQLLSAHVKLMRAHVTLLRGHINGIACTGKVNACARNSYCVVT